MNAEEIEAFKKRQDDYVKVLHTEDGRIYEQKGNSLKKELER